MDTSPSPLIPQPSEALSPINPLVESIIEARKRLREECGSVTVFFKVINRIGNKLQEKYGAEKCSHYHAFHALGGGRTNPTNIHAEDFPGNDSVLNLIENKIKAIQSINELARSYKTRIGSLLNKENVVFAKRRNAPRIAA